jgi:hypothetical protein
MIAMLGTANAQEAVGAPRCGTGVHESEATGTVPFPQDQIFCPLTADPKEPRSFVSLLRGTFPSIDDPADNSTTLASVGLGDAFGLVRLSGSRAGDGLQFDITGAIFAQFDLGAESNDLINADYIIGVPMTFRARGFSTRVRLYHQSSHLGDEYLLRNADIQRDNLSFESLEFLVSQEVGAFRGYVGGERVFRRDPATVAAKLFHAGAELRTRRESVAQLIAGVDVKITERHNNAAATSGRVGLELKSSSPGGHPSRLVTLLLEIYKGPSPYGQFFQDDISYIGVGVHFSL